MAIAAEDIRQRLLERLAADSVDVEDESARHVGHAGAREGGGHYRARIVAAAFAGKNAIARHRIAYEALSEWMGREIHAISMTALTPEEERSRR